jgi:hypothetical protein
LGSSAFADDASNEADIIAAVANANNFLMCSSVCIHFAEAGALARSAKVMTITLLQTLMHITALNPACRKPVAQKNDAFHVKQSVMRGIRSNFSTESAFPEWSRSEPIRRFRAAESLNFLPTPVCRSK